MASTYIFGTTIIDSVVYDSVELVEAAESGAIGQSSLTIDDPNGTINIIGLKRFVATESDCGDERTLRGYIEERTYERGVSEASNSRQIRVTISDLNDLLAQRALVGRDAKRPRETVNKRIEWLLGTPELGDLVETSGRVNSSTEMMDKADHRNSYPGDVLAECAQAAGGFNYYVWQDEDGTAKLAFRNDNTSNGNTSVLSISNVSTSIGSNVFAPMDDATLTRSPENTFSKAILPYARGTVTETRHATASNYQRRDGIAPNSNVKSAERASKLAREFLWEHKAEEDIIECEIEVPGGAVNLVKAGDRIACQFGHFGPEGYAGWTYMRVLETRKKPLLRDTPPSVYRIGLKLSPQEPAEPACSYDETASGTYLPLGEGGDGNPDWGGPVVYYLRPGISYPIAPVYPADSRLHFWTAGYNGYDTFASGFENEIRFVLVGNGTATIQTERWEGQAQPYTIQLERIANGVSIFEEVFTGTAGDSTEVEITTADPPNCIHVIRLRADARVEGSYIGMGWSSMVWVAS